MNECILPMHGAVWGAASPISQQRYDVDSQLWQTEGNDGSTIAMTDSPRLTTIDLTFALMRSAAPLLLASGGLWQYTICPAYANAASYPYPATPNLCITVFEPSPFVSLALQKL